MRNPLDRLGLSHGTRVAIDWVLTIVGAVALPAEPLGLPVAHRAVRSLLCSRRHSSIRPWSPESSTSGTVQPRNSAGRV